MGRGKVKEKVAQFSEGVLANLTDLVLWGLFYGFELTTGGGGPNSRTAWKASQRAEEDLSAINYQQIKAVVYYLKKKGLITYIKEEKILKPQITAEGKRRLEALVPHYDKRRIWDGKIYLVTYDIPEEQRGNRDILRQYLRKIGCGMLQRSVWLTPYNPSGVLKEFIEEHGLSGAVIVSSLGKDGSIGKEDLSTLLTRVYHLDNLHGRYLDFISKYEDYQKKKKPFSKAKMSFDFYSILSDDPQLPFELLPDYFAGPEAYNLFRELLKI